MNNPPESAERTPFIYLALPVMEESALLPRLLGCLQRQTWRNFHLYVCVNQPDSWWDNPEKADCCLDNMDCLEILEQAFEFPVTVIDRSSKGKGWVGKQHGVGWARKTVMDAINGSAGRDDIIVSLDADTMFPDNYLQSIVSSFHQNPDAVAISIPYYHLAEKDDPPSRAILRYEIYMRHYLLNLMRIGSPYAFTALGSAMAVRISAYRAIGGMTPKLSGEDFYFLQKLRKFGPVLTANDEKVFPEARFSNRVFFGTGPAMIKGASGDWSSYPVYPVRLFDDILETYLVLPVLFLQTFETPVIRFLAEEFREKDPLGPLRANYRTPERFSRAFHEKFDGLRLLQYLKRSVENGESTDEENLAEFFNRFYPGIFGDSPFLGTERFENMPFERLSLIRDTLYRLETATRLNSIPA